MVIIPEEDPMPGSRTPALPDPQDLEAIVRTALERARARGADQAEGVVSRSAGLSVNVRLGEVENLERSGDRSLGVTVYFGNRKASASTADLSPEAVEATVAKACSIARFTAEDACSGLADAQLMQTRHLDLDLSHPWDIDPDTAIGMALEAESAAMAFDSRINNSEGASLATHQGLHVYGNTHGFLMGYPTTSHSVSCVVLAGSGDGMQRDHWYTTARDWRELESPQSVGQSAARRTVARLEPRRIATRRAPVLFSPELARGLISHFVGAVRGTSQYREASFLLRAAGQQVFPDSVNITEHPHVRKGLASAPFDDEGVATADSTLVAGGVLQRYVLSSYSARKLGLSTTANAGGVHNLQVEATSTGGLDTQLRRMDTGLLVSELMGQGVNGITGDYSRGAAGFWVEKGCIQFPVAEITIAGNLRDMLRGIVSIGDDVDMRGGIRTGSILVEQMTIAGE